MNVKVLILIIVTWSLCLTSSHSQEIIYPHEEINHRLINQLNNFDNLGEGEVIYIYNTQDMNMLCDKIKNENKLGNIALQIEKVDDFSCLSHIEELYGLYITLNHNTQEIDGFKNLKRIGIGGLSISGRSLSSLRNFQYLEYIKGGLYIKYCYKLSSLDGLENLRWTPIINIDECKILESIASLSNIKSFEETLGDYSIRIINCPMLTDFCPISHLVKFMVGKRKNFVYFYNASGNKFNPQLDDILNGNCSK